MATRSYIAILNDDDQSVDYIYCHWDGYPTHNGKILFQKYTTEKAVRELLKNGDMSTLSDSDYDGLPKYYNAQDYTSKVSTKGHHYFLNNEWNYLFKPKENKWYCRAWRNEWFELTKENCGIIE